MVRLAELAALSAEVEELVASAGDSGQDMVQFMLSSFVQTLAMLQADWDAYRAAGDQDD